MVSSPVGGPFTADNRFGSFTLLLESVTVSYCPFVAVLPHCAPRPGVCRIVWVPHWLGERNTALRVTVLSVRLICLCGDFEFAGCVVQLLILLFPACHGVGAPPLGG